MRHAGTRLCAQQLATLPTTYCGICVIPLMNLRLSAVVRFPPDWSYFSSRAAGSETVNGGSNPSGRDYVLTQHLLLFVTAAFLLGIYFLPVAVVLGGG